MAALRDLLEVYGAFDQAVGRSSSAAVAATADDFLPKFSANPGWYREVESFFFGEHARRVPDLGQACSRIGRQTSDDVRMTNPQKSRLLYGLVAAARLHQSGAKDLTAFPDLYLMYAYIEAMAACGNDGDDYDHRIETATTHFERVWTAIEDHHVGRANFTEFRAELADAGVIEPAATVPPLCQARVIPIDGLPVVVVDTTVTSPGATFNEVKEIVNPYNWNENYPDFFIRMYPCAKPERGDQWFRVLETVGFRGAGGLALNTALKYHTTQDDENHVARIDYDLDDPTPGEGDGKVLVDRGYINVEVCNDDNDPAHPGVRARTRKVVHIAGLSPFAQARLVCVLGYGTASSEFLFGRPDAPPPYPRPFGYYDGQDAEADPEIDPADTSTHVVATAVNVWAESVQGLTHDYFDMAEKWFDGGLRLGDVADYSAQVSGRLLGAPWEFLERVNFPRHPRGRQTREEE